MCDCVGISMFNQASLFFFTWLLGYKQICYCSVVFHRSGFKWILIIFPVVERFLSQTVDLGESG